VSFVTCGCMYLFMGFVMCECFDNCVGVLVICVLVSTVFRIVCMFRLCIFILLDFKLSPCTEYSKFPLG